ncbi:Gp37-like protein [Cryobacterium sp. AP23]
MDVESITVEVRGADLVRVGQFDAKDLSDFICVPRMNTVGSWSIKLPDQVLDEDGRAVLHPLCWAVRQPSAGIVVTGMNGVILSGPMTYAAQEQKPEDPEGTWTIEGVSDAVILARAVAYPDPSLADAQASSQSRANDVRTGTGESLLRQFTAFNICNGALRSPALNWAPAGRLSDNRLRFQLEGETQNRGSSLTKRPRFQNLLELLQEIALGSGLIFDVVQILDGLQFRITEPVDVSQTQRWDVDNNQLSRAKYGFTAPGCTHVIAAGQGEGTARLIVEVSTTASRLAAAVWGRSERFTDQRNAETVAELQQAGLDILAEEGKAITSLEVVPSADLADGLGVAWMLGSMITVVVGDQEIQAPITETPISISSEGVIVGATVGDPTGFDWEALLSSRQSKLSSRVSALERNAK